MSGVRDARVNKRGFKERQQNVCVRYMKKFRMQRGCGQKGDCDQVLSPIATKSFSAWD